MGVSFKKIPRKDPRKTDATVKYYPQLVTLGANANLKDMAYVMKERSSLTLGDIKDFGGIQPFRTDRRSRDGGRGTRCQRYE